jgi:hypothetical protein
MSMAVQNVLIASQRDLHLKHDSTLHASKVPANSNLYLKVSCFALELEACFGIPGFGETGNFEARTLSQGRIASPITIL